MRLRQILRQTAMAGAVCTAAMTLADPALAQDNPGTQAEGDAGADNRIPPPPGYPGPGYSTPRMDPAVRETWLADCRKSLSKRDSGLGGAVIGGVVGGIAGNRIAGRGHRTAGTVAGAAIGTGAGMLIGRAGDDGRARDECETYLEDYEARYTQGYSGYGYGGYGYGYPAYGYRGGCCMPTMMVPVIPMPRAEPQCTETVEYVYEDVPARPARRVVPDKRVKIVPDKRIPVK